MTLPDYSSDEIAKVAGAVMISGMAVAMVDMGVISTAIEAAAMAKEVSGAAKKYPTNTIIQSLFSEEAVEKAKAEGTSKVEIKAEDMKPDTAVATANKAITEALAILETKATPEEIKEYKEFIYSCADAVANAAGSGLFGTGEKVSPSEAAALAQLKATLGL
jgi:hypothetical protein